VAAPSKSKLVTTSSTQNKSILKVKTKIKNLLLLLNGDLFFVFVLKIKRREIGKV